MEMEKKKVLPMGEHKALSWELAMVAADLKKTTGQEFNPEELAYQVVKDFVKLKRQQMLERDLEELL